MNMKLGHSSYASQVCRCPTAFSVRNARTYLLDEQFGNSARRRRTSTRIRRSGARGRRTRRRPERRARSGRAGRSPPVAIVCTPPLPRCRLGTQVLDRRIDSDITRRGSVCLKLQSVCVDEVEGISVSARPPPPFLLLSFDSSARWYCRLKHFTQNYCSVLQSLGGTA